MGRSWAVGPCSGLVCAYADSASWASERWRSRETAADGVQCETSQKTITQLGDATDRAILQVPSCPHSDHASNCPLTAIKSSCRPAAKHQNSLPPTYLQHLGNRWSPPPHTTVSPSITMANRALPYFLEDRTGRYASSEFDDIYDRLFLRVAPPPEHAGSPGASTLMIYNAGRRSSRQRDQRPQGSPSVILEFGHNGAMGKISFAGSSVTMPMTQYLKKTAMFGG